MGHTVLPRTYIHALTVRGDPYVGNQFGHSVYFNFDRPKNWYNDWGSAEMKYYPV